MCIVQDKRVFVESGVFYHVPRYQITNTVRSAIGTTEARPTKGKIDDVKWTPWRFAARKQWHEVTVIKARSWTTLNDPARSQNRGGARFLVAPRKSKDLWPAVHISATSLLFHKWAKSAKCLSKSWINFYPHFCHRCHPLADVSANLKPPTPKNINKNIRSISQWLWTFWNHF